MKRFFPIILFHLFSFGFGVTANAGIPLKCYLKTDYFKAGVGISLGKGEGRVFCDEGSSVPVKVTGWSLVGVGASWSNRVDDSDIYFKHVRRVEDIEGFYMGWGFQIPFPIIKNLDIFKLRKGRIRLYWNMAPHGFKVEFPQLTNIQVFIS